MINHNLSIVRACFISRGRIGDEISLLILLTFLDGVSLSRSVVLGCQLLQEILGNVLCKLRELASKEELTNCLAVLRQEGSTLESVLAVLDQFSEVDHETPGERAMHVQALEEDLADLLLNERLAFPSFFKQEEKDLTELVSVTVRVP